MPLTIATLQHYRQSFSAEQIVTLIGIGIAMSLLGDATLYIVLPTQYGQAGIVVEQVGIILAANRAIRLLVNSPYGMLIERIPRRWLLIPSLFLGSFASLLYTIPGFEMLLIGRLLWGTAWAGLAIGGTTVIFDIATDEKRGRYVGRYQMWFFIGVGLSSLVGGFLFDTIGYAPTFYTSAVLIAMGALLWLLFLPETRHWQSASPIDATPLEAATNNLANPEPPLPRNRWAIVLVILLNGINWLIFIGVALSILPLLLEERLGTRIGLAGLLTLQLVSFTGLLSFFNTLISLNTSISVGWLSDRSDNRWRLIVLGLVMGVISLSLAAVGQGWVVIVATMLNAVVSSILIMQTTTIIGDIMRGTPQQGRTLGFLNTAGDLGGAVGPMLAFVLLPMIDLQGVFSLAAGLLALMLLPSVWMMLKSN